MMLGRRIRSGILKLAGVRFEHQRSSKEYLEFLSANGRTPVFPKEMPARTTIMYAECKR